MGSSQKQVGERQTPCLGPHWCHDPLTSQPLSSREGRSVSTPSTTCWGRWWGGVGFLVTAASRVGKTPSVRTQGCL